MHMVLVQHWLVHFGLTPLRFAFIKRLVAALKQIQLRIEKLRVAVLVHRSILVAQETQHARTSLRRELTVENEDQSLADRVGLFGCLFQLVRLDELLVYLLLSVQVMGVLDVATFVLVRVA